MRLLEHLGQDFARVALTGSCLISFIISDPPFFSLAGLDRFSSDLAALFDREFLPSTDSTFLAALRLPRF